MTCGWVPLLKCSRIPEASQLPEQGQEVEVETSRKSMRSCPLHRNRSDQPGSVRPGFINSQFASFSAMILFLFPECGFQSLLSTQTPQCFPFVLHSGLVTCHGHCPGDLPCLYPHQWRFSASPTTAHGAFLFLSTVAHGDSLCLLPWLQRRGSCS